MLNDSSYDFTKYIHLIISVNFKFNFNRSSFDQNMTVLMQTLACQLSSILMQLLFSFDQDKRVV